MKVGITGATGLVGRQLCRLLLQQGHDVVAWCREEPVDLAVQNGAGQGTLQWIPGRLGDTEASRQLADGSDAIVHAAVDRNVSDSRGSRFVGTEGDPPGYFQTNVIGSIELLESAVKHRVKRFVFVSSGAVHDRVAEDRKLDESHPLGPSTIYGAYKASVETLIHAYGLSGKLTCCTVRPTAVYGIRDELPGSKWFSLINDVVAGRDVAATGGRKEVHCEDVAEAIMVLLQTDQPIAGETFNCSDRMISSWEVAHIAKRLSQSTSRIEGEPKTAKHVIDTSKLQNLGMQFGGTEKLESTIGEMIQAIKRLDEVAR